MKLRISTVLLLLCGLHGRASAQTTKPTDAWVNVVQQFATSLADPNGADDSKTNLSKDCGVRSFKDSANTLEVLQAHVSGTNLLMSKAYIAPVTTLADDVATAIRIEQERSGFDSKDVHPCR